MDRTLRKEGTAALRPAVQDGHVDPGDRGLRRHRYGAWRTLPA